MSQSKFDLLGELRNVNVNIPLFQAIRDIPIYSISVRELCLKKPRRKRKDPPTVYVIGDLVQLVMGNTLTAKYDPGSHVVKVQINGISLYNTLIDLGVAINVMTKHTMERLGLKNIRQTTTILHVADQYPIRLEGVIEDDVISVDSWEYLVDFMVLQTKSNLGCYHLILG